MKTEIIKRADWIKQKNLELEQANLEAGELIKNYCLSQKELWQKIPYLALKASAYRERSIIFLDDEIRFFPPQLYKNTYQEGFWELRGGLINVGAYPHVDLTTGNIVKIYEHTDWDYSTLYFCLSVLFFQFTLFTFSF